MSTTTYPVQATKSGAFWHLEVEGLPQGTQVRKLSEAKDAVADLANIFTGEAVENVNIDLRIQLPEDVAAIREEAHKLFEQAKESNALAAEKSRLAARLLKEQGMTLQEIGQALDVSYQRVAQLVAA